MDRAALRSETKLMQTMELSRIVTLKGERLLVRKLEDRPTQIGSFYIPEAHRDDEGYRGKKSWRGIVERAGDKVDFEDFNKFGGKVALGTCVILSAESVDCPSFKTTDSQGNDQRYIFVYPDDIIGVLEPVN